VDINETILEVIALTRSEMQRNRAALQTQLSSDLPLVLADRTQLQQVILNLIMNAIEAMSGSGEGPRELLVGSGRDDANGVLVAVRDSGPGLDPDTLDRLFEAFYTTKPDGIGMGLAISRSIIEAHGGRLWATPNDATGAEEGHPICRTAGAEPCPGCRSGMAAQSAGSRDGRTVHSLLPICSASLTAGV
jgi:signal transduction histidine kinase